MTELNIGEHCAKADCNQLDFLPIQCNGCKQIFCKLHSSTTAHDCQAPTRDVPDKVQDSDTSALKQRCQFPSCTKHELLPLACEACHGLFCIGHKQKETHQCPKLWTATDEANAERQAGLINAQHLDRTALQSVSRPLHHGDLGVNASTSKPASSRARATAARLVLMQAKMHAKPAGRNAASLSAEDRFVIRLSASDELNPCSTGVSPFFVGKTWPLGRVLDFAQEHFAVKTPSNGARLALIHILDDPAQPEEESTNILDLSQTVGDCVQNGKLQEACLLQVALKK